MVPSSYVTLYVFPTGRRIFAHKQVRERAEGAGLKRIVTHSNKALAHDAECAQLELTRRGAPTARFSPEAGRLDAQLDRAITGLDGFLESHIRIWGEDSEEGHAAATIRGTVFPDKVGVITQLPYVQEDAAVAAVFERLAQPDLARLAARIPNFEPMIARVRGLHSQYHEVLMNEHKGPTTEDVRAMQMEGQELLCCTVAMIVSHWAETRDAELCRQLIAPIDRQGEEIRVARQRRRIPRDVDPDTGEEVTEANLAVAD